MTLVSAPTSLMHNSNPTPDVQDEVSAGVGARHLMEREERQDLVMCGRIMAPLYGIGLGVLAGVQASHAYDGITPVGIGVAAGGVSCAVIHAVFKRALRQDAPRRPSIR